MPTRDEIAQFNDDLRNPFRRHVVVDTGLVRVSTPDGGHITACLQHAAAARSGHLTHTMDAGLRIAQSWISRHTARDCAAAVFALGVLYDPPRCCPAADFAQSVIMAAFRDLTRGEA
jgi:hypothetical protein